MKTQTFSLIIGLILLSSILSGCSSSKTSVVSSTPGPFQWANATVVGEIVKNDFPEKNWLQLRVIAVQKYTSLSNSSQILVINDTINVYVSGAVKQKCIDYPLAREKSSDGKILPQRIQTVCNESINMFEGWTAEKLTNGTKIVLPLKLIGLEGGRITSAGWIASDSEIEII